MHVRYTFQFFTENIDVHRALSEAIDARIQLGTDTQEVIDELTQIKDAVDQVIADHDNPTPEP